MLATIWERIGGKGQDALIALARDAAGNYTAVRLRRRKQQIDLLETQQLADLPALESYLQHWMGLPIALYWEPAVLLEERVENEASQLIDRIMGMPVEDPSQFIVRSIAAGPAHQWASLVRKEAWEPIKNELGRHQERLVQWQVSPAVLTSVPSQPQTPAHTHPDILQFLSAALEIESTYLLPYAMGIHTFTGGGTLSPPLLAAQKQIRQQTMGLKIATLLVLGTLLLSVGIGTVQWGLKQSLQQLQTQFRTGSALWEQMETNQAAIQAKSQFLQTRLTANGQLTHLTPLLDQMMALVPATIQLKAWQYQPEAKWLKKQSPELLAADPEILIQGEAQTSADLTVLGERLENLASIQRLNYWEVNYDFERKTQTFTLLLWLHEK